MFIIYTMAVWATFFLLHTHSCSAPTFLHWVQQWRSDAFSPAQKHQFPPQQKWVVVVARCWHTQQGTLMFPKKHIHKKPIPSIVTVKQTAAMCLRAISSEDESSSALVPLSYAINIGTNILVATSQPRFFGKTRILAYWHKDVAPCSAILSLAITTMFLVAGGDK